MKAKYDEDIEYYKSVVANQQPRDSIAEDDLESSPSPQKSLMMNKIIEELRENEEHYIKNESSYKSKISELESKLIECENALYEKENNKKESIEERPSLDPNNKYILQIQSLNSQIQKLKFEIKEKDSWIKILKDDIDQEIEKWRTIEDNFNSLSSKYKDLQFEFISIKDKTQQTHDENTNYIKKLEKEIASVRAKFEDTINYMKTEIATKDGIIKGLSDQMDDLEEIEQTNNPFGVASRIETEGSLFDELGGDTGGRSFSMCPGNYKNVAKRLKKRALFLEAKLIELRNQNKMLLDDKAEVGDKVEIAERDSKNIREQMQEIK